MFAFMDRVKLSRLFARWARENDVRTSGEAMLAWLQANGLLNMGAARTFVKGSET